VKSCGPGTATELMLAARMMAASQKPARYGFIRLYPNMCTIRFGIFGRTNPNSTQGHFALPLHLRRGEPNEPCLLVELGDFLEPARKSFYKP
jgi:hypothetical protein